MPLYRNAKSPENNEEPCRVRGPDSSDKFASSPLNRSHRLRLEQQHLKPRLTTCTCIEKNVYSVVCTAQPIESQPGAETPFAAEWNGKQVPLWLKLASANSPCLPNKGPVMQSAWLAQCGSEAEVESSRLAPPPTPAPPDSPPPPHSSGPGAAYPTANAAIWLNKTRASSKSQQQASTHY